MAESQIGTTYFQYHLKALGTLEIIHAKNRNTFPISMIWHLESFIFTKPKINASGGTAINAEMGARSKRKVRRRSTGKSTTMSKTKMQVQKILWGIG
jgi:hypothetical protein